LLSSSIEYKAQQCGILICACNDEHFGIFDQMDQDGFKAVEKAIFPDIMPSFEANLYDCYRILKLIQVFITSWK
jgi:hypothetical protein